MPAASSPRRVLVVDDHSVVRHGFRQLIDEQPDLSVAGEAATFPEGLDAFDDGVPDLVLMDVMLGEGTATGLDLIKQLNASHPEVPVLCVSMHDEALYARRALAAGAQGYAMKRVPDEELLQAMRQVLAGRIYVSDAIRERLLEDPPKERENGDAPVDQLTDRELEVFLLVGRGLAPRHIAERLNVSVKTVESHRRNLRQKLKLESSSELVRYAVAWRVERGGEDPENEPATDEEGEQA